MNDRVVLLGGGGFIGRSVVSALRQLDSFDLVVASRKPRLTDGSAAPGDRLQQRQVDATNEAALVRLLDGATGVVNLVTGDADTIRANARALFGAVHRCSPVPRVVHVSSMAVYGRKEGTVCESTAPADDLDDYGAAKLAAERLAALCPRTVVLRPGIVFGPESPWWSIQIAHLLLQRRLGDLAAAGNGICNLLYVEDMAEATVRALTNSAAEGMLFNLAMSSPPTWNEYLQLYSQALGIVGIRRIAPLRLQYELRLRGPVLKALEKMGLPLRLAPPIRPWLMQLCRQRITLNVSAAERVLGMHWSPLAPALKSTAASRFGTTVDAPQDMPESSMTV